MLPSQSTSFHHKFIQPFCPNPSLQHNETKSYIDFPSGLIPDFQALETHPLYSQIKEQFLRDITTLKEKAHGYVSHQYDDTITIFYDKINHPVDEALRFNLLPIYRETRYQIHCLVQKLTQDSPLQECASTSNNCAEKPRISKDRMAIILHDCLIGIELCFPAIHSRFANTTSSLAASENNLQNTLFRLKKALFHSCIHAFLINLKRSGNVVIDTGMEVHWFNKFYNLYCDKLGFEKIEDRYIPTHNDPQLISQFIASCPFHVNECSVVQEIAKESTELLIKALTEQGVLAWQNESINPSQMTNEILTAIDNLFLTPVNSLFEPKVAQQLTLWNILERQDDDESYHLHRYQEKLLAWIAQTLITESPKVLAPVSTQQENTQYIAHISSLFFWVFESKNCFFEKNIDCQFESTNHISLNLTHLAHLSFSSWPSKLYFPLLMQALNQTNSPKEIAAFFLNSEIQKELSKIEKSACDALFNLLNEKIIKNSACKSELITLICEHYSKLATSFPASTPFSLQQINWFVNTELLESVLRSLKKEGFNISNITRSLGSWQISSFSLESIKTLFPPEDCLRLCNQALNLKQFGLMAKLIKTNYCNAVVMSSNEEGQSPLHLAAKDGHIECIKTLLANSSININAQDNGKRTALHYAALEGNFECIESLLSNSAININMKNKEKWTALHFASSKGHLECIRVLLNRPNIAANEKNSIGWTALHYAAYNGNIESLNMLINSPHVNVNSKGMLDNTPLHLTTENKHVDCLITLLNSSSVNVNAKNEAGETALHIAAKKGHIECINALIQNSNVNVNARQNSGGTALHFACTNNHYMCVVQLLKIKKIDVNTKSNSSITPLHTTASFGHSSILNLLLTHPDIHVNAKCSLQRTPLIVACETGCASSINILLNDYRTKLHCISSSGHTALSEAIYNRLTDITKRIKADPRLYKKPKKILRFFKS